MWNLSLIGCVRKSRCNIVFANITLFLLDNTKYSRFNYELNDVLYSDL